VLVSWNSFVFFLVYCVYTHLFISSMICFRNTRQFRTQLSHLLTSSYLRVWPEPYHLHSWVLGGTRWVFLCHGWSPESGLVPKTCVQKGSSTGFDGFCNCWSTVKLLVLGSSWILHWKKPHVQQDLSNCPLTEDEPVSHLSARHHDQLRDSLGSSHRKLKKTDMSTDRGLCPYFGCTTS